MSILGTRVLRTEDPALLTIGGTYVDDLTLDGAAWVTYVRSTIARARIASIDTSEAVAAPGVIAVFTAEDLDLAPAKPNPLLNQDMVRPFLADDTVRFVGELVAAVVTETRDQGEDAAELVLVDYEPLDPVVDPRSARTDEALVDPAAGTNVVFQIPSGPPDPDLFAACDVVVEATIVNQRVAPVPLGVRAAASQWVDGRLTQWSVNQGAHGTRDGLAAALGLDGDAVRVITPDVGGGFGAVNGLYPPEVLCAWIARKVERPVRWVETRTENMLELGHGRGQIQTATLGGTADGRLLAYKLSVLQDSGAYPLIGSILPFMTRIMATGVYDIANLEYDAVSVLTNTCPVTAYRGAGRPEATAAIERMIDLFAAKADLDPAEIRRKNFIAPDAFPFTTPSGAVYDSGDYEGALDRALEAAAYDRLREEQGSRRAAGDPIQLGIGVSAYVEITNPVTGGEYGSIAVRPDGSALVRTGTSPHGQGHYTAFAMIASELTGIALDRIEVTHGDTDDVPRGGGTGGSKSLQLGGTAITMAGETLIDRARELAAELLEANPDDVVLDATSGAFHVTGTPAVSRTWSDVAEAAARTSEPDLFAEADFTPDGSAFPFGAHVAVVEVDTETGRVVLRDHFCCDDAGRIINPLLVDGQVHGGVAQGVSQALYEEFRYDEDGNPITANLTDYSFPAASEFPSFTRVAMETPTPLNLLGAKGIGESGTIGSTPAVQNAVVDALAPNGVTHIDMPLTPERVWSALTN